MNDFTRRFRGNALSCPDGVRPIFFLAGLSSSPPEDLLGIRRALSRPQMVPEGHSPNRESAPLLDLTT